MGLPATTTGPAIHHGIPKGGYRQSDISYVNGGDHVLVAKLRTSDRDAAQGSTEVLDSLVQSIRARWPHTRIILRGDSGFARDGLMDWCESHGIYYLLGLAKNKRLLQRIGKELGDAHLRHLLTGVAARVFTDFAYLLRLRLADPTVPTLFDLVQT